MKKLILTTAALALTAGHGPRPRRRPVGHRGAYDAVGTSFNDDGGIDGFERELGVRTRLRAGPLTCEWVEERLGLRSSQTFRLGETRRRFTRGHVESTTA